MILTDNTVLSNYALAGRLSLLQTFCQGHGLTTNTVVSEFEIGVEKNPFPTTDISWIRQTAPRNSTERHLFRIFQSRLGTGEAACLAVAISRGHSLLTDDMDARKIALREGVAVSGSIGVLVRLAIRKRISLETGNALLQKMIDCGYFSPVEKLDTLIDD